MEKDKLLELIESLAKERKNIEKTLELQREEIVIKGLEIIYSCLQYANEMLPYFAKINANSFSIRLVDKCSYYIDYNGGYKCFSFSYHGFSINEYFKWEEIKKLDFQSFSKDKKNRRLGDVYVIGKNGFSIDYFKKELNNYLADEIVKYQQETNEMKNKLI